MLTWGQGRRTALARLHSSHRRAPAYTGRSAILPAYDGSHHSQRAPARRLAGAKCFAHSGGLSGVRRHTQTCPCSKTGAQSFVVDIVDSNPLQSRSIHVVESLNSHGQITSFVAVPSRRTQSIFTNKLWTFSIVLTIILTFSGKTSAASAAVPISIKFSFEARGNPIANKPASGILKTAETLSLFPHHTLCFKGGRGWENLQRTLRANTSAQHVQHKCGTT